MKKKVFLIIKIIFAIVCLIAAIKAKCEDKYFFAILFFITAAIWVFNVYHTIKNNRGGWK